MDNDEVKCPHCGEITHIGGLIGEHTNDCPRCGKHALYPPSVCPKCNSTEWDWANIGFTDTVQCLNCGNVYIKGVKVEDVECEARKREQSDRWPFPTIDKPLTPLTPKEVKTYNKAKVKSLGDSIL